MSTQSGLLAAVEAQLLVFFKDVTNFKGPNSTPQEVTLIFTYVAVIASVSATISSLILTDEFAELPVRAARDPDIQSHPSREEFAGKDWQLLQVFGLRSSVNLVVCHCVYSEPLRIANFGSDNPHLGLVSLLLASLCTVASIATYAISQEGLRTLIIVSVATGLSVLPVAHFFIRRSPAAATYRPPSENIPVYTTSNGI
jgi:hypothetical protein